MNPWINLPNKPPLVLEEDAAEIASFNANKGRSTKYWIHTGKLPEPRLGPKNATIVLLQLNPSYHNKDTPLTEKEILAGKAQLSNEYSPHPYLANSNKWWDRAFHQLLKIYGREKLSKRVCSIEYFPYPSLSFNHSGVQLSSDYYQTNLVRSFIDQGSIFVVTRSIEMWYGRVPELRPLRGERLFETKNKQRVTITPGNLDKGAFDLICDRLNK